MDPEKRYSDIALDLARKADPYPNPRVGAVIVKDGRVIGLGYHKKAGLPHAEIEAIAYAKRNGESVESSTLYVTLEPCSHTAKRTPPCTLAIMKSRIAKVVYSMKDPNPLVSGAKVLQHAGIRVVGPVDQRRAESINRRYLANLDKPPVVTIKMAMSADGKTATHTGDSRWISCPESRDLVHKMRADCDAVMVGGGTVSKDDPALTAHGKGRNPYRIIVDGDLHIPLSSRIIKENHDRRTIIATSELAQKSRIMRFRSSGAEVFVCGKKEVDLAYLVAGLSAMGIKKILIEGGNELNAKAIRAGIVDNLYLFMAPKIIGGKDAKPVIGGSGIAMMSDAIALSRPKIARIGEDLLLKYKIEKK